MLRIHNFKIRSFLNTKKRSGYDRFSISSLFQDFALTFQDIS
ncbi:hypothetical protein NBRC111894_2598 [Sporolactobacillus inulinus]|uniref:Uncharacterized protein n=1 Tax=Sporolactobacillus inulinus TaxID=2078 RepID=A0A4Y1ZDH9_9BACL|nr:hypothetical protein NBRC111894_2598 [Sporolactobacillus inulinus]